MKALHTILALALMAPAFAQDADQKQRTYRVFLPERLKVDASELFLFNGKISDAIRPAKRSLSPVYQLPNGDITLSLTLHQVSKPEAVPKEAIQAKIPSANTDLLLLILNDPKNLEFPIKITVIDIGDEKLKAGESLWINHTLNTIHAELGSQKFVINPESQLVSKAPIAESGYYKASFDYQSPKSDDVKSVMRKSWWHDATSKSIGFVVENEKSTLPSIYSVRDRR